MDESLRHGFGLMTSTKGRVTSLNQYWSRFLERILTRVAMASTIRARWWYGPISIV